MKNIFFNALMTLLFACNINAATAQTAADEAAVREFFMAAWATFNAGDIDKSLDAFTEKAGEIGPDGSLLTGKQSLRESYEAMMKMVDAKPSFSCEQLTVRFITADVAITTFDSNADIKIGGQQVGGKTKGMAVLHKINGKWLIEFDSSTPVLPPPTAGGN